MGKPITNGQIASLIHLDQARGGLRAELNAFMLTHQVNRPPLPPDSEIFTFPVNYGVKPDIDELKKSFDWVWDSYDSITDLVRNQACHTVPTSGVVNVTAKLLRYSRAMTGMAVIDDLALARLRPATFEELLGFGLRFPDVQMKCWIIALGSEFALRGHGHHVACLSGNDNGRGLSYNWFNSDWGEKDRFLAIRK